MQIFTKITIIWNNDLQKINNLTKELLNFYHAIWKITHIDITNFIPTLVET